MVDEVSFAEVGNLDTDCCGYKVEPFGFDIQNDHVLFQFKVSSPNGAVFFFRDRYSDVRYFFWDIEKHIGDHVKTLPKLPPSKLFGTKDAEF